MTREEAKGIIYNAVLEATSMLATWENTEEEAKCLERFIEASNMAIEALSQPERPKGRWIETCVPDVYQCSHCKKATKMDEFCDSETLRSFCPNCGADMRGEEE